MARTVFDTSILLSALSAGDSRALKDYTTVLGARGLKGQRIGELRPPHKPDELHWSYRYP